MRRTGFQLLATMFLCASVLAIQAQEQKATPSQQPESDPVYRVGDEGLQSPRLIRRTLPGYTAEAQRKRVEGKVLVRAVVRKDGSIDSFEVLKTPGYGLDKQTIREISENWEFQPGEKDGEPVDVYVSIEVSFTLRK